MKISQHATKKQLEEFNSTFPKRSAVISECQTYRYSLSRTWDESLKKVGFIMLNPSTADHREDDPTIRRCIAFAKAWGYGGIVVANLFALRSTDPKALKEHKEPVGPHNDEHILSLIKDCEEVVCAWGVHGKLNGRDRVVMNLISGGNVVAIKVTKDGSPGHPLYVKSDAKRNKFLGKEGE